MKKMLLVCFLIMMFIGISFLVMRSVAIERGETEMEILNLPAPRLRGDVSVEETILKRRSVRSFSKTELTKEEISQLVWAEQGITQSSTGHRASPSAGATYPLELYVMNKDGLYHYEPHGHKLKLIRPGDLRSSLSRAALRQPFIAQAPVDIVITAVYQRTAGRYRERATRYVHIEVGHVAENIHLQAVALGLGSVPIGAFIDDEVKRVLSLPKEEVPLYIIPVGHEKS